MNTSKEFPKAVKSLTVIFYLNGRRERSLFFERKQAQEYADRVKRWPNVSGLFVVER